MCDQVARPLLDRGAGGRSPGFLQVAEDIPEATRRIAMALSPRREFFTKLALLGGFAALGSSARAKAQTMSSVTTEDITCDNGMPAVLAYPAGGGSFPTVILMHERYGLVRHTRDQAMRCARDGYAVLAPNFFFRHPDQTALNGGRSRYDLTDPESVELIKVALATLT